jgi:hypothetical protein
MARRGSGGGGGGIGGGGMMAPILSIATGLIIFVVLIIFAPTIAGSIQLSQPELKETCAYGIAGAGVYTTYGVCDGGTSFIGTNITEYSDWNGTHNTDLPDGVDLWTTNIQILGVVILIISIAVAMYFLKGMA